MNMLHDAVEVLNNGWCQGSYRNELPEGKTFCAVGALLEASGKEWNEVGSLASVEDSPEIRVLSNTILANYPDFSKGMENAYGSVDGVLPCDVVVTFNDEVAESSDEVIAMFEKAAVTFDEKSGLTDSE